MDTSKQLCSILKTPTTKLTFFRSFQVEASFISIVLFKENKWYEKVILTRKSKMNILSLKRRFFLFFFVQGNEFFSIRCLILTLESPLLAGKPVGGLVKQRKLVSFVRVSVSLRCPVNGSKVVFQTYCFFFFDVNAHVKLSLRLGSLLFYSLSYTYMDMDRHVYGHWHSHWRSGLLCALCCLAAWIKDKRP